MKQPEAGPQHIVIELTEEQSRQIQRATGKFVAELQIEIVEVTATIREPLAPNHNNPIEEGETQ